MRISFAVTLVLSFFVCLVTDFSAAELATDRSEIMHGGISMSRICLVAFSGRYLSGPSNAGQERG